MSSYEIAKGIKLDPKEHDLTNLLDDLVEEKLLRSEKITERTAQTELATIAFVKTMYELTLQGSTYLENQLSIIARIKAWMAKHKVTIRVSAAIISTVLAIITFYRNCGTGEQQDSKGNTSTSISSKDTTSIAHGNDTNTIVNQLQVLPTLNDTNQHQ
jgi:hypothetical protein